MTALAHLKSLSTLSLNLYRDLITVILRMSARSRNHLFQKSCYKERKAGIELGWPDLNRRMQESKSCALPLGDSPKYDKKNVFCRLTKDRMFPRLITANRVDRGTRTLNLQNHNLAL